MPSVDILDGLDDCSTQYIGNVSIDKFPGAKVCDACGDIIQGYTKVSEIKEDGRTFRGCDSCAKAVIKRWS